VLSTRVDLFAEPYTSKLQILQEGLAPVASETIRSVVQTELCGGGDLAEVFSAWDDEPLGCASIAQARGRVSTAMPRRASRGGFRLSMHRFGPF